MISKVDAMTPVVKGAQGRIIDRALGLTANRTHFGSRGGESLVADGDVGARMQLTVTVRKRQIGGGSQAGLGGGEVSSDAELRRQVVTLERKLGLQSPPGGR